MKLLRTMVVAVCFCNLVANRVAAGDPLSVAKELAESKYKDWTYGTKSGTTQIDCVHFVLAVIEESVGASLSPKVRNQVLIADLTDKEKEHPILGALVLKEDARTKGVQRALVEANLGKAVSIADAAPGDLVQYWMKKNDGTWFGHSGVIESIDRKQTPPTARIFGAHATPAPGRIGTSSFNLRLLDGADDRRIYIARIK